MYQKSSSVFPVYPYRLCPVSLSSHTMMAGPKCRRVQNVCQKGSWIQGANNTNKTQKSYRIDRTISNPIDDSKQQVNSRLYNKPFVPFSRFEGFCSPKQLEALGQLRQKVLFSSTYLTYLSTQSSYKFTISLILSLSHALSSTRLPVSAIPMPVLVLVVSITTQCRQTMFCFDSVARGSST